MRTLPLAVLALALAACGGAASPSPSAPGPAATAPQTLGASTTDAPADAAPSDDVLDAIERHLQADPALRGELRFTDVSIEEAPGWRFVLAGMTRPDGSDPGHCPDLDGNVTALLRAADGGWQVVRAGTCSGDIYWLGWPLLTGAPASVMGVPDDSVSRLAFVRETSDGFLALRSEPSVTSGERLARIPAGTSMDLGACRDEALVLDGAFGRWCEASFDGRDGWAFTGFLD